MGKKSNYDVEKHLSEDNFWEVEFDPDAFVEEDDRDYGDDYDCYDDYESSADLNDDEETYDRKRTKKDQKGKKKKKRFGKKLITAVLVLLALGAGLYFGVTGMMSGYIHKNLNYDEIESIAEEPLKEEGVTNILLIGNDSRVADSGGRSDAMILVSISDETKKIYLTSLLRDMYVEIPGKDQGNRLNHAYSYGGAELLMETVELNFDIEVNRYVQVNFQAFANLIDTVGGVELEVTNEEVQYINGYLVEYNNLEERPEGTDYLDASLSGNLHLNGPQALAYCRNRYIGSDFGRTERQRKVISAAISNAPQALLNDPMSMMDGILPNLTTNLTEKEMASLMRSAAKILAYDIEQSSIPIEGSYTPATIREMSVLEVDFEKNKEYIQTNIYGK